MRRWRLRCSGSNGKDVAKVEVVVLQKRRGGGSWGDSSGGSIEEAVVRAKW